MLRTQAYVIIHSVKFITIWNYLLFSWQKWLWVKWTETDILLELIDELFFNNVTNIFHHIFRVKALDGFYGVFAYI